MTGTAKPDNPTIGRWFNTDAYQTVTCQLDYLADRCHYGNNGQGTLRGPGFKNLDFSLFKNFALTERARLQFRSEFFNLTNTPNFGLPNSTLNAAPAFQPVRDASGNIGANPAATPVP